MTFDIRKHVMEANDKPWGKPEPEPDSGSAHPGDLEMLAKQHSKTRQFIAKGGYDKSIVNAMRSDPKAILKLIHTLAASGR